MLDSQVAAFALAAAILTTPGQDTLLVVRNVFRGSTADGVTTTLGICSGLFMHATLSAVGMSIVLSQSATMFHGLKGVGALYLVWPGVRSLTNAARGRQAVADHEQRAVHSIMSSRRCFLEGLLSNALNPKTAMFYLAFLPQFISTSDAVLAKSLLLAGGEALIWLIVVSAAVGRMRSAFTATVHRWLDTACGAVFVGLGMRLALERQ